MNKNIYKFLLAGIALAATVASCDLNKVPEFDEADAFAAFTSVSYSIDENKGQLSIPVTIASINPIATVVSYKVIDGDGESGAKAGIDYKVVDDGSSVLTFDGTVRTQNIVIDIIRRTDESGSTAVFTGDLTFKVVLESAGSINLGADNECTVTIVDLDHPLSDVLGTYTATSNDGTSWTLTMLKDAEDQSMVWIDGIVPYAAGQGEDYYIYATVSSDHKTISIPNGQVFTAMYSSYYQVYLGFDGDYIYGSGTTDLKLQDDGTWYTEGGFYLGALTDPNDLNSLAGYLDMVYPGITLTKN